MKRDRTKQPGIIKIWFLNPRSLSCGEILILVTVPRQGYPAWLSYQGKVTSPDSDPRKTM